MKKIIFTALIAIAGIGSASADYNYNLENDIAFGSGAFDASTLPATAAGSTVSSSHASLPDGFDNKSNQ